jgi:preprotein translocase subunit YajC
MEPLIVLAITFVLLWLLFILPQQRRVRAHQALVDSVQPGDQVILSAGIFGRIVDIGPEEMTLEVAPGVVLRVARQAVLRRVEDATDLDAAEPTGDIAEPADDAAEPTGDIAEPADDVAEPADGTPHPGRTHPGDTEPNLES